MGSDSGMFWILCEMFSWHRIMLLSEIGVKIEGCALKAADLQQPNKERTTCFWFLIYRKACACVFLEVLKLFFWSWCLALNQHWLEVEKRDGGYWQERSVLGGVLWSCWLWGDTASWALLALCKVVTKDGLLGKGVCPACSCIWLAARDRSGAMLRKNDSLLAPLQQCVGTSWGPEQSQPECEHPLILLLHCARCRICLSSCPPRSGATSCKALLSVRCLILGCAVISRCVALTAVWQCYAFVLLTQPSVPSNS